jgi:hypothetical protein
MSKMCIAIGVNKVVDSTLPPLNAAEDAKEFHAWAQSHSFQSTLLTDQGKDVTLQMIKDGVNAAIEAGAAQLVVYFGGHGILKAPETEVWLLSGAMNDSQQAVNLAGSVAQARNGKIPNVIFISDACRSVTTNQTLFRISGGEIFPPSFIPRPSTELDRLYATLPGSAAADFADTDSAGKYHGVYTKCLMRALEGEEPSAIEMITDNGAAFSAVSSRSLKPYLLRSVPDAAAEISITLNQCPDSIVESQVPKYIVKIVTPTGTSSQPLIPSGPIPPVGGPALIFKTTMGNLDVAPELAAHANFDDPQLKTDVNQILATRARVSFETHTGFTVVGEPIANVRTNGISFDLFSESSADGKMNQIRVDPGGESRTVLVQFAGGTGTCLAVLPGFIGAVTVEKGVVVNVSYTPSHNTNRYREIYRYEETEVEKRRAYAAAAAQRGQFRVNPRQARAFGNYVRGMKSLDPTLGLYAIYSYFQANMREQMQSVLRYMEEDARETFGDNEVRPVLFDAKLLADRIAPEELRAHPPLVAPFCPLLTQGWSYLFENVPIHPMVRRAGEYLLPGLWTTFTAEGVGLLKDGLGMKELQ